jgi:hypothetical protein
MYLDAGKAWKANASACPHYAARLEAERNLGTGLDMY